MNKAAAFFIFIVPLVLPAVCRAEGWSFGLGYPYLSAKYDYKVLSAEGRLVTGSGVKAYSGRGYWNFSSADKLKGFTGLELGLLKFDTLDQKGKGYEAAVFAGGEYFMSENVSLLMDFAPTLVSLKTAASSVSVMEFVVNLGLYYHFGGPEPKAEPAGESRAVPNAPAPAPAPAEVPLVPTPAQVNAPAVKNEEPPAVSTASAAIPLPGPGPALPKP